MQPQPVLSTRPSLTSIVVMVEGLCSYLQRICICYVLADCVREKKNDAWDNFRRRINIDLCRPSSARAEWPRGAITHLATCHVHCAVALRPSTNELPRRDVESNEKKRARDAKTPSASDETTATTLRVVSSVPTRLRRDLLLHNIKKGEGGLKRRRDASRMV